MDAVSFTAAERHHRLAKLYCLLTEPRVNNLSKSNPQADIVILSFICFTDIHIELCFTTLFVPVAFCFVALLLNEFDEGYDLIANPVPCSLHCMLSGAVYCYRSCLWACLQWAVSVITITRNCVHRSSPNWVCRCR